MTLQNITAYWRHWVSKDNQEDPLSFLSLDDDGNEGEGNDSDKGRDEDAVQSSPSPPQNSPSPSHFSIDDGVLYPFKCTPSTYTNCLQRLVPESGQTNLIFHELVKLVDTLEVSFISDM